jgi:MFS family permease
MAAEILVRAESGRRRNAIFDRELTYYPEQRERSYYLALTVLATIALYYQSYAGATVAPQILAHYGITLKFYLYAVVVGFVFGALATVLGGLADRIGRVNLVAYGLVVVGILVAFVHPHMPNKWLFAGVGPVIGLIEGVVLVATPALIRDFSPRMGRAAAMGFWALGPVLGSLCATEVSSHTLRHLTAWQDQFEIAGISGLVVTVIVLFGLRELRPSLRDQIMVSTRDRALVEARAKGIDVEAALSHPWRQMITPRIVSSGFAISVFLMFYYIVVGFFVIYLETTYGYSGDRANSLANWYWIANAIALMVFGLASDRLRVRKPFMLVGGVGSLVMTIVFLSRATHVHTSFHTLAYIISAQAAFAAMVYAPWMASFTETVEDRNPALVATGLAVWGGVLRIVVAFTAFCLPFVVTAVTPLVDYGPRVASVAARYPDQLRTLQSIEPATLAILARNPGDASALVAAVGEIERQQHVAGPVAVAKLTALSQVPAADLAYLAKHGPAVARAVQQNPRQWQHWWWVTAAGQLLFLPLILTMTGEWRPSAARRRDEEQERKLEAAVQAMA